MSKFDRGIILALFSVITFNAAKAQIISTVAGHYPGFGFTSDGVAATATELNHVDAITLDTAGNLYIADSNQVVRKVDAATGIIHVIAGTPTINGYSGDGGQATAALLAHPKGIAVDKKGNLYIADQGNNRIRKVDASGIISTIAGNGSTTYSGDGGAAATAGLGGFLHGIWVDDTGSIYIATGTSAVRKIDTFGIIHKVTGLYGGGGYRGDGGPATAAWLDDIIQICFDRSGNMYIADGANNRVRKINTSGIITTVAGGALGGFGGDGGPATAAKLYGPSGVFVDSCDNLYIADINNNRIRMVNSAGIITTISGNGTGGYGGDGLMCNYGVLNEPSYLWIDKLGGIYIADHKNAVVRYIQRDSCNQAYPLAARERQPAAQSLNVSPNPTNGSFRVHLSCMQQQAMHITVTDAVGRRVYETDAATNKDVELHVAAAPGIYYVTCATAGERWMARVVVIGGK